ncbi:MAG: Holliday junction branch migration protein RuvA [Deltaproteobacteria bacterium]|nr:Holliday junction branch migration protein RuvA [Deltaproteobacteria bacterium]
MIARISGTLIEKSVSHVIVDANGIGYRIFVPLTTFYELPEAGAKVALHTYTNVRQDAIHLFGFYSIEEKDIFELMIAVTGIGPKLAVNILSGIAARDLIEAISHGSVGRLVGIPGVGRKTAERMVLELKDKLAKLLTDKSGQKLGSLIKTTNLLQEDAVSALVNLGYKSNTVRDVIEKIVQASEEKLTLDLLLKKALKQLSG